MRIIQAGSRTEAVHLVAQILLERVQSNPSSVLGLATGQTMVPVYAELSNAQTTDFTKTFFFMLDEYLGLPENHASSFKTYIQTYFIRPLKLKESQFAFPPVIHQDGPAIYENLLKESGGVDLQLLGIGRNGHVGFNEPGSLRNSRTRIVTLTDETIEANRGQFTDIIPAKAFSLGIGTILESKSLLMLVTGQSKANAIKYLLNHHDDPACPATYLKAHPHFTLVLDPDAASRINLNI